MSPCATLIVAAGRGHRAGGGTPKQYRALAGRAVLRHCLARFCGHPALHPIRVVIHADDRALYDAATRGLALPPPVMGGATRQESVLNGLEALASEALASEALARVLIHDAVRPFVSPALIDRVIGGLDSHAGAIAAVPVTDTLKRGGKRRDKHGRAGEVIAGTVPRAGLWRAQTPQGFRFAAILAAHRAARGREMTDDAAVAEAAGLDVALVIGDADNMKITTEEDFARAERILAAGEPMAGEEARVGHGLDVHRFGPPVAGAQMRLCGIGIAHPRPLIGHSDADVGLHAATDALLGALGLGDIGAHFPPSDARWRGADSATFLRFAADRVADAGGRIVNLDVTLICEAPRIAPHRAPMVARMAEILGIAPARVSVKATTTERLGFPGREEGIVAEAVVALALPRV